VVESDWPGAEEDKSKRQSGQGKRKLGAAVSHQAVMKVNFGDGDGHIDANGKSRDAGEQAKQNQEAAKELGESGEIRGPAGESQADYELHMVVKAAENFVVSVVDEYGAQGEAHDEERERLQAIEVAQLFPSGGIKEIDYSSEAKGGSGCKKEGSGAVWPERRRANGRSLGPLAKTRALG
jgi:hypothetical protein